MSKKKSIRTRGKLQFSKYFQELKEGDFVSISQEKSIPSNFKKRLQGITGVVEGRRGKSYLVKIKDHNEYKTIIAEPIHLKKIKQVKQHDNKQ